MYAAGCSVMGVKPITAPAVPNYDVASGVANAFKTAHEAEPRREL